MRILLMTLGSRGDVQPFIALGCALKSDGHDVAVSTAANFTDMIEKAGLRSAPVSVDMQAELEGSVLMEGMRSVRGLIRAWRLSQDLMQTQLQDVWDVAHREHPDVIVYHPKAFSAVYAARSLGIMAMPVYLQPAYTLTGAFPNPIYPWRRSGLLTRRLNRAFLWLTRLGYSSLLRKWFAKRQDVPSKSSIDVLTGYHPAGNPVPRFHAFSQHLVPSPDDYGIHERTTGYWFVDPDDTWQPPADLEAFLSAGPAPVYVGFGSMPSQDARALTRDVVAALDMAGQRGIIATGWSGLSGGDLPPQHFALESAPHSWLFPRCAAVVHHGGAGSTHEGLRWGRPTVICPVFGDQPFWGYVVARLGAGPRPVKQKKITGQVLADRIIQALDPAIASAAEDIGSLLRAEGGARQAADLITEIARDQQTAD
ncbi:Glycosyl transferase/GT1 [Candidatus Phaeomarinobacter ectocarpi]|uniref:Glycosyl transferase/GT1 n=2 Tax=Candidatus Phaeomarinibacter ectocarpi TaxID=1458461 RepID=X5MNJ1_9HYPH|nr:Glycosyl transferase/GT1 [Candidatus Phaeomarinobacter ectocarpi]